MKVESDVKPNDKFLSTKINDYLFITINNLSDVEEFEKDDKTFYFYNSYKLKLTYYDGIEKSLNDNYEQWLKIANDKEYDELASAIRTKRDKLLEDTDWTMMEDVSLSEEKKTAYKEYRQALRDITEQSNFPYEVEFPKLEV